LTEPDDHFAGTAARITRREKVRKLIAELPRLIEQQRV